MRRIFSQKFFDGFVPIYSSEELLNWLKRSKNNLVILFSTFVKILHETNSENSKALIIIDMNFANGYEKVKVVDLSRLVLSHSVPLNEEISAKREKSQEIPQI